MNKLKRHIDYSKHPLRMTSIYIVCSILLFLVIDDKTNTLFGFNSISLILISITFSLILYYFLKIKVISDNNIKRIEVGNYDFSFLIVKTFEILFQQLFIVFLLAFGKQYLGDGYIFTVILIFVLLHFQLLLFHSIRFTLFYILGSIPAILLFVYIYLKFGLISFGVAFSIHLSLYLLLGILDLKGNVSKFIGD